MVTPAVYPHSHPSGHLASPHSEVVACPFSCRIRPTPYGVGLVQSAADKALRIRGWWTADLTILKSDPYAIAPEKLMEIRVSETWIAGERKLG